MTQSKNANPYNTPRDKIWVDPMAYNTLRDGPDFFSRDRTEALKLAASTLQSRTAASSKIIPKLAPMPSLLTILRAAAFLHQSHHWKTSGPTFYADHLLFERLYSESLEGIDALAEKSVGLGYGADIDPVVQINAIQTLIQAFSGPDLVESSRHMESFVLLTIDAAMKRMEVSGTLTSGVDNLLQGLADVHEGFIYLLQQRQG